MKVQTEASKRAAEGRRRQTQELTDATVHEQPEKTQTSSPKQNTASPSAISEFRKTQLCVGFFKPDPTDVHGYQGIYDGEALWFTDVYTFCDHLQRLESVLRPGEIQQVLGECLQGDARIWYNARPGLKAESVGNIIKNLKTKFRPTAEVASRRLAKATFTWKDSIYARDVMAWVRMVARDAMIGSPPNPKAEFFELVSCTLSEIPDGVTMLKLGQTVREFKACLEEVWRTVAKDIRYL
ncbi:hypothetical protein QBC47DRAFT_176083 [Echria macrotheca]|uniref:Uncharacterized protein n=1 Tax=Echria macrotheca TaxID=438768 RepID=A0AAJ0BFA4_9PEZI|nr:hypothetical protein QBC47DRAFT_176083 [Echria macrotheca]